MAEYIERGAALREAKYAAVRGLDPVAFVEDVPVADVAPVVHGRWINVYPDIEPNPLFMYGICSNCGFEQGLSDKLNYCPNCGAKMDGSKA